MTDFVKWVPEFDGHKPLHWREGMVWKYTHCEADGGGDPRWNVGLHYSVPREAVYGPKHTLSDLKKALSKHPAEELAKHGITLAPELDWATELWADALDVGGFRVNDEIDEYDKAAIELLRSRVVPKEASDA